MVYVDGERDSTPLIALTVTSRTAKGRIGIIADKAAPAVPGVVAVMTHRNAPRLRRILAASMAEIGTIRPLQDDRIRDAGQAVAAVIARWDADGGVTVHAATQWVHIDTLAIGQAFGLGADSGLPGFLARMFFGRAAPMRVRLVNHPSGGAFGRNLNTTPMILADLRGRVPDGKEVQGETLQIGAGVTMAALADHRRSADIKLRDRASCAFARASAAMSLQLDADGKVARCAIVLGGIATKACRAVAAEQALPGRQLARAVALATGARARAQAEPRRTSASRWHLVPALSPKPFARPLPEAG